MAAAQAGPRLGRLAAEAAGRAGVEDLVIAQLRGRGDLGHVLDQRRLALDGHVPVLDHRRQILDLAPLGPPFRHPAVQHRDIGLAHQPEQPPDPRRREQAGAVIDHHLMAVADAHRAQPADELLDRRRHVRQVRALVGDLVDVEEPRARDMAGIVFGPGVAPHLGQVPRGVKNPQIGVFQMGGKPVGRDQRLRIILRHRHPPVSQPGIVVPGRSGKTVAAAGRTAGTPLGAAPRALNVPPTCHRPPWSAQPKRKICASRPVAS